MAATVERRPLAVGDVIHGFAYGAFGRDHYDCVRVEAAGPDWIVARDSNEDDRTPSFTCGRRSLELCVQARDEGHQTPWGEAPEPCPMAHGGNTERSPARVDMGRPS
ncbi:hypothetical protein [Streptomyces asiaticus]|uniref:hypothetical protein n=1 Tax=Streptomyces asiaticus TaxID=114695 RepID=UPI001BAA6649|nr:hypothetical protein [Streptomyces asiaticus]